MDTSEDEVFFGEVTETEKLAMERVAKLLREQNQGVGDGLTSESSDVSADNSHEEGGRSEREGEPQEEVQECAVQSTSAIDHSNTSHIKNSQVSCSNVGLNEFLHQPEKLLQQCLENESDSILNCSVSSSSFERDDLDSTLDQVDMLLKYGPWYAHGTDMESGNEENVSPQLQWRQESSEVKIQGGSPLSDKVSQNMRGFLEDFHNVELRRNKEPTLKNQNKLRRIREKPIAGPSQRRKQNYAFIKSPVAAYIKQHPTKLVATAVNVKPSASASSTKAETEEPLELSPCFNLPLKRPYDEAPTPKGKSVLPLVTYEKAPTISCLEIRKTPKILLSATPTPKVLRHAVHSPIHRNWFDFLAEEKPEKPIEGRAVLSTVPRYACMINTEVSVIVDKDVSETDTL